MLPCEACHRPMMVRSVVVLPAPLRPSSMVSWPGHGEIDAVQDVVRADMRVHAFEFQQVGGARLMRPPLRPCRRPC